MLLMYTLTTYVWSCILVVKVRLALLPLKFWCKNIIKNGITTWANSCCYVMSNRTVSLRHVRDDNVWNPFVFVKSQRFIEKCVKSQNSLYMYVKLSIGACVHSNISYLHYLHAHDITPSHMCVKSQHFLSMYMYVKSQHFWDVCIMSLNLLSIRNCLRKVSTILMLVHACMKSQIVPCTWHVFCITAFPTA